MKEEQIIKILNSELRKCKKNNEIPVAALIIKNTKLIAKGHNSKQKTHDITNHAEIVTLRKASKKIKDWRLEDCIMYVTLEPCNMCKEAIKQSRIKEVYYYVESNFYKINSNTNFKIKKTDNSKIFKEELRHYFESKR